MQRVIVQTARLVEIGVGSICVRLHNVSYATFAPHPKWAHTSHPKALNSASPLIPVLAALILSPIPSLAADPPVWGYLDNGMGYVLLESHAAPVIGSSVIVHSGSAREDFATSGASHFLEHLLFNGTESRTQEQLYDEVDALGGYNNATTRKTHVAYMLVVPAENVGKALEIQRDMLFHSTLAPEKVEKERGIILEEFAKDTDAGTLELDRLLELGAFGPHGPGLPTLGSPQSIRTLSRETIAEFYHRLYTPQNMTLVVLGDFRSAEMEEAIRQSFGAEPPGSPPPEYHAAEPSWDATPLVGSYHGASLVLEWTWPGPDPRAPGFTAFDCLTSLLSGEDALPLNRALRERFPGMIRSSGGRIEMVPGRSFLRFQIEADPSLDWREVAQAFPSLVERARLMPAQADIDAWRVSRETEEYFLRERPSHYAIMRGEQLAAQGLEGLVQLPDRLAGLSPADLAEALRGWAGGAHRMTVALPRADAQPETQPAPPAQTSSTPLPNGAQLLVLSSPESPVLAIHLFFRGRSEAEPAGMDGAVELLHRLLPARTAQSDPATLSRKLRAIGAELKTADDPNIPYDDFYSTSEFSFLRLQTLDPSAAEAFSLLAEMLASPGWTDQDFEETRQAMLVQAQRAAASATAVARSLSREALYPGRPHARAVFGTPATLNAITPASLRDLARSYFVAGRLLVVVATGLPPEQVQSVAASTLGRLPAGQPPASYAVRAGARAAIRDAINASDPIPAEMSSLSIPDSTLLRIRKIGGRQASILWVRPLGSIDRADLPAVEVWNAILSADIQFQLREREGLAYSIGSAVDRLEDGTVLWIASAGAGAQNLPRILQGFRQSLERGLSQTPDSSAVRKQGAQLYGRSLMRRTTRMNRSYAAGLAVLGGRDPAGIDDEIRAPTRVKAGDIEGLLPSLRRPSPGVVAIAY